jgi:hypothetical protein
LQCGNISSANSALEIEYLVDNGWFLGFSTIIIVGKNQKKKLARFLYNIPVGSQKHRRIM